MDFLSEIFSSRTMGEMLRLLFGPSSRELYVREIERLAGLNIRTIRQALGKLQRLDLVKARKDGNRLYYKANENHPLYPDLHNIVLKTSGLAGLLGEALEGMVQVAFIFGSIARGEANADSDIDLMVIGDIGLREVSREVSPVAERVGREITPHVMTPREFAKRRKERDHFLIHVLESPKLFVIGNGDDLRTVEEERLA